MKGAIDLGWQGHGKNCPSGLLSPRIKPGSDRLPMTGYPEEVRTVVRED